MNDPRKSCGDCYGCWSGDGCYRTSADLLLKEALEKNRKLTEENAKLKLEIYELRETRAALLKRFLDRDR